MKKPWPFLIVAILILLSALSWHLFFTKENRSDTLRVSGNIEVTEVQLGFKIPGRLEQRLADEGDMVFRGDLLARMENQDQKIGLGLAQANLARAESVLAELTAGSRPEEIQLANARVIAAQQALLELTRGSRSQEIESARSDLDTALAALKSAQSQLTQTKEDYERFSILFKKKSATQRDFELYRTRYEIAQNELAQANSRVNSARQALSLRREGPRSEQIERARAVLGQVQAEYDLVKAGPRKEKIDQAQALIEQAVQTVNQAKQQLSYTELFAPMDGVILTRSAEPGEYLNPSTPVITLGDLSRPWLRAFINETDLGRIHLQDKVVVTIDSFPDKKYAGILSFISSQAEFTPKSVQTFEERVKLMFRIKIDLENPHGELKPGMPADALIALPVN
ncbi:MAG: efflux RND transporter periplasmic adaptor subunit [Proteobacteria bacterium]|nr:HlyD family efflux transporter periplasmic adaptor subunit [Desulfobacula sp.]MBU3953459.1 efflux RND transporter periplasmic adaptor subunit [Pseudomonadota bacterium]MBU4130546.1 efflux RND transporter periplasmic adaptor subunit [Pseudomonadota bacterium]